MKIDFILSADSVFWFRMYFDLPSWIERVIVTCERSLNTGREACLFELSKVMVTVALVMPALPCLYISSCRLVTLTWESD